MGLRDQIRSLVKLYVGKSVMVYELGAWVAEV